MQDSLTVINETGFNAASTFYIFNETLPSFHDLAVTTGDGQTTLALWNQTTYYGLNCTFWVNFPVANASYWLYWNNPSAINSWDQEAVFNAVIPDLVLALPMDSVNGVVEDFSGNGYDGTASGTIEPVDGRFAGSTGLLFNDDAYLSFGDVPALTDLFAGNCTITAWYNSSSLPPDNYARFICSDSSGTTRGWVAWIYNTNGYMRFTHNNGSNVLNTYGSTNVCNGSWNLISLRYYVSGPVQQQINLATDYTSAADGQNLVYGSWFNVASNPAGANSIGASLDDFYIFSRYLSDAQLAALYSYFPDPTLETGTALCRVYSSVEPEVTEFGAVESAAPDISTEETFAIALILGVFALFIAIVALVRRRND